MREKKNIYCILLIIFLAGVTPRVVNGGATTRTIHQLENEILTRYYSNLTTAEAVFANVQEQERLLQNTFRDTVGREKLNAVLNAIDRHLDEWDLQTQERTEAFFNKRIAEEIAYVEREFGNLGLTQAEKNLFLQRITAERYAQRLSGIIGELQTNIRAINDFIRAVPPHTPHNVPLEITESAVRILDIPEYPQSLPRPHIPPSPPPIAFEMVVVDNLANMRMNMEMTSVVAEGRMRVAREALSHTNRAFGEFIESENLGDAVRRYYDKYNTFISKLPPSSDAQAIAKNKNRILAFIDRTFKEADFLRDLSRFTKESLKDGLKNEIKIQAFIDETVMMRRMLNGAMQRIAHAISLGDGIHPISIPVEIMNIVRTQTTNTLPNPPLVLRDFIERMSGDRFGGRLQGVAHIGGRLQEVSPTGRQLVVPRPPAQSEAETGMKILRDLAGGEVRLNQSDVREGFAAQDARMSKFTHFDPRLARPESLPGVQPIFNTADPNYLKSISDARYSVHIQPSQAVTVSNPSATAIEKTSLFKGLLKIPLKLLSFFDLPLLLHQTLDMKLNQQEKAREQYGEYVDHAYNINEKIKVLKDQKGLLQRIRDNDSALISQNRIDTLSRDIDNLRMTRDSLIDTAVDFSIFYLKQYNERIGLPVGTLNE